MTERDILEDSRDRVRVTRRRGPANDIRRALNPAEYEAVETRILQVQTRSRMAKGS